MKTVCTPHDHLFKAAMANRRVAKEFLLASYLPPAIVAAVDLDSLVLMPNSYVDKALKMVLSDVVYQVKLKAGETAYIYALCEHQFTCDPMMPHRIWQYVINI